jgi:hypothetical protein
MNKRDVKMLRKSKANAETRKRWSTPEGWFRYRAWNNYDCYQVYVKDAIKGFMRHYFVGEIGRRYVSGILYKVKHLRELP